MNRLPQPIPFLRQISGRLATWSMNHLKDQIWILSRSSISCTFWSPSLQPPTGRQDPSAIQGHQVNVRALLVMAPGDRGMILFPERFLLPVFPLSLTRVNMNVDSFTVPSAANKSVKVASHRVASHRNRSHPSHPLLSPNPPLTKANFSIRVNHHSVEISRIMDNKMDNGHRVTKAGKYETR